MGQRSKDTSYRTAHDNHLFYSCTAIFSLTSLDRVRPCNYTSANYSMIPSSRSTKEQTDKTPLTYQKTQEQNITGLIIIRYNFQIDHRMVKKKSFHGPENRRLNQFSFAASERQSTSRGYSYDCLNTDIEDWKKPANILTYITNNK